MSIKRQPINYYLSNLLNQIKCYCNQALVKRFGAYSNPLGKDNYESIWLQYFTMEVFAIIPYNVCIVTTSCKQYKHL